MTEVEILGLQRRMRQLGEIRIGHTVDTGRISEKTNRPIRRPAKLDKFRLTSASRPLLEEVAKLYGGTVQPWTPANGGPQEWEVYTTTDRLPVIIPPRNAVTQKYEMYQGSRCVRRCDGRIEEKSDRACMCDPERRDCQITTRLNVMLRDVPGLGVWLLTSHGYYAAVELPPVAEFLASTNGYVNAWLTMELVRIPQDDGPPFEFMVPKLDVAVTPAQLLAGEGAVAAPEIEGRAPRAAIEAPQHKPAEPASPAPAGFLARVKAAGSAGEVTALLREGKAAGADMKELSAAANERMGELRNGGGQANQRSKATQTAEYWLVAATNSKTLDELSAALKEAQAAGFARNLQDKDDKVAQAFTARRRDLDPKAAAPTSSAPINEAADRERLWAEIVTAAGMDGFDRIEDIEQAFAARWNGDAPSTASSSQLATFLEEIRAGKVRPPQPAEAAPPGDKPPF